MRLGAGQATARSRGCPDPLAGPEQAFGQPPLARLEARDRAVVADGDRFARERADRLSRLRCDREQRVAEGHRPRRETAGNGFERQVHGHAVCPRPALARVGEGGATLRAREVVRVRAGAERQHACERFAIETQAHAFGEPRDHAFAVRSRGGGIGPGDAAREAAGHRFGQFVLAGRPCGARGQQTPARLHPTPGGARGLEEHRRRGGSVRLDVGAFSVDPDTFARHGQELGDDRRRLARAGHRERLGFASTLYGRPSAVRLLPAVPAAVTGCQLHFVPAPSPSRTRRKSATAPAG